jgi:tetratricopeptide (TPR) repeat protein
MSQKRAKKKSGRQAKTRTTSAPPDRRAMEKTLADVGKLLSEQEFDSIEEANAFLQQVMGSGMPISSAAHTPLEQAQEIMYEAWEASGQRRVQLAREALSISEDCADAYVLLAEESVNSLTKAKELYEAGVKAGERALGADALDEYVGHFWGVLETRPYMRARAGLAACLWQLGQRQEAIEHYQEMLRLNPGDNQGIRYILLPCLMAAGLETETEQLLAAYPDDAMAMWRYTRALFLFHKEGASQRATRQLREALEYNPHVPDYLLGHKRLPRQLPPYIGFGDESEAVSYAAEVRYLWKQEPGALDWLREVWTEMS